MQHNFLSAGEFARYARTTKRTVHWYAQKGILVPRLTNRSGYRYYDAGQILDFQIILLLRQLNFSLEEIKLYVDKHRSLKNFFKQKRIILNQEIEQLRHKLHTIDTYYGNLEKEDVLVSPTTKKIKSFEIYYIDVLGSYAHIRDYGFRLNSYFERIPRNATYLTIFLDKGYRPKSSNLRIGVIKTYNMKLQKGLEGRVGEYTVPSFRSLSYTHVGPSTLLSLLWQELHKYQEQHKLVRDDRLPFEDLELYHKTSFNNFDDPDYMIFEILMPIR